MLNNKITLTKIRKIIPANWEVRKEFCVTNSGKESHKCYRVYITNENTYIGTYYPFGPCHDFIGWHIGDIPFHGHNIDQVQELFNEWIVAFQKKEN